MFLAPLPREWWVDGVEGNLEGGWPASAQPESHLALALAPNSTSCHRLQPSDVGFTKLLTLELGTLRQEPSMHSFDRAALQWSTLLLTPDLATLHILLTMWFTIFNTYY